MFRYVLAIVLVPSILSAQHPGHPMPQQAPMMPMAMMMIDPLGVSMERMGSGTTWIPDAVPLPSRHVLAGSWLLMLHGFGFVQNRGYPMLLQSGETYRGQPLVDRQHPHDFWMELAAMYERALSPGVGVSVYAAPSGEPALGPVAFMHRPSAMDNLAAPLSHHRQDATHISFGVLTAGLFGHHWKLEGSVFNGREPNEERWGFDRLRLDSYSGRFTLHMDPSWVFSAGYGFLKSPDPLNPSEAVHRATASVLHGRKLGMDGQIATAVIWGANRRSGRTTHSALAESEAVLDRRNTIFGRLELVQKTAEDLVLPAGPGGFAPDSNFTVAALSVGYIREVVRLSKATLGVGFQTTLNVVPSALDPIYGSRTPVGGMVFVRIRPLHGPHTMSGSAMD
jgi:hypothetical protein